MAEAHPVGFRWVMKARERGAKVIHVDPRFGRTGASADLHVPIRPGTDIAFLGGLIRHVIETGSYFRDYVVHYTNAATIIDERFRDTEDLDGVFSGFDPETGTYDRSTWMYDGGEVASASSTRRRPSTRRPARGCSRARSSATRRWRTPAASSRSSGATTAATRPR